MSISKNRGVIFTVHPFGVKGGENFTHFVK